MNKFVQRLFKVKLSFKIPKKKDILIYDNEGAEFIIQSLEKDKYEILHTRGEILNVFIYLKLLFRFRFNYKEYLDEYIKFVEPKVLITFIDNNLNFYEYKNKKIKKIAIQNGRRTSLDSDIFSNLIEKINKREKYFTDYLFVHSKSIKKIYEKFINGKICVSGSFRSNNEKISVNKKVNDILYISTFRNTEVGNENKILIKNYLNSNYTIKDWINHELRLLKWLRFYSLKYNRKISILGSQVNYKNELYHYQKNMNCKFNFIKKTNNRKTYQILDESRIVVGIDSTLLNEALGRGCNVVFFSYRGNSYPLNSRRFGWPENFSMNGKFWTKNPDYQSFSKTMNFYNSRTNTVSKNLRDKVMVFDKDNKKFQIVLNNILKR